MRPLRLVLLLAAVGACVEPDPPEAPFLWGHSAGGGQDDFARAVSIGPDDSVFVTGTVAGTVTFGAGDPAQVTLTASDGADGFVAKYHADGSLAWARLFGGPDEDHGNGIAATADGGAIVTGSVRTSVVDVDVDDDTPDPAHRLLSTGGDDIVIAKYRADGSLAWARLAGGIDNDIGHDVAATADGGALVTGEFQRQAVFGDGAPGGAVSLSFWAASDIFVARYDGAGQVVWARAAGGDGTNVGRAVAVAADGGALVTGEFRQTARFGDGDASSTSLRAVSAADVFVAKLHADGSLAWARRAGSSSADDAADDVGWDIAATVDNGMLVTGEFGASATFGAGEAGETTLVTTGIDGAFLVKLDGWGYTQWAQGSRGTLSDVGTGVAATPNGGAVITGRFHRNTTLAADTAAETALVSEGPYDIFLAEFAPDGALVWAERAGGYSPDDIGYGIAMTGDGGVVVAGAFADRAIFGERTPYCPSLRSAGQRDIFVAKRQP